MPHFLYSMPRQGSSYRFFHYKADPRIRPCSREEFWLHAKSPTHAPPEIWNSYGAGGKSRHFPQPKHSLNAEPTLLSAGSIDYRFPLFHSSYEMRVIVMNASRVRPQFPSAFMRPIACNSSALM